MISSAPPGMASSAGWKKIRTAAFACSRYGVTAAAPSAAPKTADVCTSCPHAWQTSGEMEAKSSPVRSRTGRASMSARMATR